MPNTVNPTASARMASDNDAMWSYIMGVDTGAQAPPAQPAETNQHGNEDRAKRRRRSREPDPMQHTALSTEDSEFAHIIKAYQQACEIHTLFITPLERQPCLEEVDPFGVSRVVMEMMKELMGEDDTSVKLKQWSDILRTGDGSCLLIPTDRIIVADNGNGESREKSIKDIQRIIRKAFHFVENAAISMQAARGFIKMTSHSQDLIGSAKPLAPMETGGKWDDSTWIEAFTSAFVRDGIMVSNMGLHQPVRVRLDSGHRVKVGTLKLMSRGDLMANAFPDAKQYHTAPYQPVLLDLPDALMSSVHSLGPIIRRHASELKGTRDIAKRLEFEPMLMMPPVVGRISMPSNEAGKLVMIDIGRGTITFDYQPHRDGLVDHFIRANPADILTPEQVLSGLRITSMDDWRNGDIEHAIRSGWLKGTIKLMMDQKAGIDESLANEDIEKHPQAWAQMLWTIKVFLAMTYHTTIGGDDGMVGSGKIWLMQFIGRSRSGKTSLANRLTSLMSPDAVAPIGGARGSMTLFSQILKGGKRALLIGDNQKPASAEIMQGLLRIPDEKEVDAEAKYLNPRAIKVQCPIITIGNTPVSTEDAWNNRNYTFWMNSTIQSDRRSARLEKPDNEALELALLCMIANYQMAQEYKNEWHGRLEAFLDRYGTTKQMTNKARAHTTIVGRFMKHMFEDGAIEMDPQGRISLKKLCDAGIAWGRHHSIKDSAEVWSDHERIVIEVTDFVMSTSGQPISVTKPHHSSWVLKGMKVTDDDVFNSKPPSHVDGGTE